MLSLDEAIAHARKVANEKYAEGMLCHANPNDEELDGCIECAREHEQLAEWLEKLKTVENIMLIYNANWYADEDNGVPDCEVLESIWNVIQGNGLDIDIEQDYRKGKADGYNKALDDFVRFASAMPTVEEKEYIRGMSLEEMAELLKAGGVDE